MHAFIYFLFISGMVLKALATDPPVHCLYPPKTPDKCNKLIEATMATEDPNKRKVSYNNAYQLYCSSTLQQECEADLKFYEDKSKGETRLEIQVTVGGVVKKLYMYAELAQDEESCAAIPAQVTPQVCQSWLRRVSPSNKHDSVALISAQQYVCLQALASSCGVALDSGITTFKHDKTYSHMLAIELSPVDDPTKRIITPAYPQVVHVATELQHKSCISNDPQDTTGCVQWLVQSHVTTDQQRLTPVEAFVCMRTLETNCGAKLSGYLDSSRDQDNSLVKVKLDFTHPFHAQSHYGYTYEDTWNGEVGRPLENNPSRK